MGTLNNLTFLGTFCEGLSCIGPYNYGGFMSHEDVWIVGQKVK